MHEVAREDRASSTIDPKVLPIEPRDKTRIIEELAGGAGKTFIFARTRNLQLLTSGRVNVLVATDVAARGIHVDDISLVIQADAPDEPDEYKTYLHRSGSTGRAGRSAPS